MDIRDAFFTELLHIAQQDSNVIILTADMGVNEFAKFRELKGQFYNVGISEQNMVSMAAGLALAGKKPFVYSIIPFITMRAFEQIKVDICSMQLPVTIIGGCAGFSNATDGGTHHGIQDISIMRTLDITILNPSCATIASACAHQAYQSKTPVYIRLDKGEFYDPIEEAFALIPRHPSGLFPAWGFTGVGRIKEGKTTIIATGNLVGLVSELNCGLIDMYQLKPLPDKGCIDEYLIGVERIITLEEHINSGLGGIVAEFMADNNIHIPLKRIGVTTEKIVGSREYLQRHFGLDVESLRRAINS